jgi:hypothetical protein
MVAVPKKVQNPKAPAVTREAEVIWGRKTRRALFLLDTGQLRITGDFATFLIDKWSALRFHSLGQERWPRGFAVRGFLKQFAPDVFRPDEISILEDALDDVWRRVENSNAPWASDDYARTARTILARYIITMAKGGERDAKWLADSALLYLSQQKLTRTPPETVWDSIMNLPEIFRLDCLHLSRN